MVDCWLSAQAAFSSGRLPPLPLFPSLCVPQFLVHHFSQRRYGSLSLSLSLSPSLPLRARSDGEATDHVGWRLERWLLHCRRGSNEGREEGGGGPPARARERTRTSRWQSLEGTNRNASSKILKNGLSFFCHNDRGPQLLLKTSMQWHKRGIYCTQINPGLDCTNL